MSPKSWFYDLVALVFFGLVLQSGYNWAYNNDFWWLTYLDAVYSAVNSRRAYVLIFGLLIAVKVYKARRQIKAIESLDDDGPAAQAPYGSVSSVWFRRDSNMGADSMQRSQRILATPSGVRECTSCNPKGQVLDQAIFFQSTAAYSQVRFEHTEYGAKLDADSCSGFGEHVIVQGISADDVCIGDVWRVKGAWTGVEIEVSSPAKPGPELDDWHGCRLRGRGGIRDYSLRHGAAGWYCRVRHQGPFRGGDVLICIKRPHPSWTLRRAAKVLYGTADPSGTATLRKHPDHLAELQELADLPQLAENGWRDVARQLLASAGGSDPINSHAPEGKKAA